MFLVAWMSETGVTCGVMREQDIIKAEGGDPCGREG